MLSAILEMRAIKKSFPGVKALQGVDLSVRKGEVLALLGENGAGKSTLMKILAGALQKDGGTIAIDGQPVDIQGPRHARDLGVAIIYQELSILPHLSVAENIFLGRMPRRKLYPWLIDWPTCYRQSRELLAQVGLEIDPRTLASKLKVADQQMVEIAKALSENAKIVVMDEPTSPLTDREVETLFETVRMLQARGVSIVYVSHRLAEVKEICNRATVLRDGRNIGTVDVSETDSGDWVRMMVGRELDQLFPKHRAKRGQAMLQVSNLNTRKLKDISFSAYQGEILGIAGLVGAGRSSLARALFGAEPLRSGTIEVAGRTVAIGAPAEAIRQGIALAPEDRKRQGLVLSLSVRENITLANLEGVSVGGQLNRARERQIAIEYVSKLHIATPSINQRTANLSGGNQQKVVLSKWLYSDAKILIIDEPTRGIDIGAKAEIYALLHRLAEQGKVVIMISSELPELIGMSDRILVMHEGRIAAELFRSEFAEEKIMFYAAGLGGHHRERNVTEGGHQDGTFAENPTRSGAHAS
jgi:ribose transport system ATP-binding protein